MGMIWVAYRRDRSFVDRLLKDPELVEELLESDDDVTSVDIDKAMARHPLAADRQRQTDASCGVGRDLRWRALR